MVRQAQDAGVLRDRSGARSKFRFVFKSDTIEHRLRALRDAPPERRLYWWDSIRMRMGLGFRTSPASANRPLRGVFVCRYRHGGKQHISTLGNFKKFADALSAYEREVGSVAKARRAIADGRKAPDPIASRRENRKKHAKLTRTGVPARVHSPRGDAIGDGLLTR